MTRVSELPYTRYTVEEAAKTFAEIEEKIKTAQTAADILAARDLYRGIIVEYSTAASLSHNRFCLNTRDAFYEAEVAYYDENGPKFSEFSVRYADLMLASPLRPEVEKIIGSRIFHSYEMDKKSFSSAIVEDAQKENALTTEYSKLMSEMQFEYEGETMPLSVLRGKLDDADREVRRAAAEAIGRGLAAHQEALDDIFDRLVKLRDGMAKKMGYGSFVELGYYRMGRMDYDAAMVARFRENVARDLVPAVGQVKAQVARELGIADFKFYDDAVCGAGETVRPCVDAEGIFAAACEMYDDMDPTVGQFMRDMCEAGAFDYEARDGKWGGGYCTSFPKFKQPFILANFNGSTADVDVITHEFGHALASHFVYEEGDIELQVGGMETAECHSMSMEFLSWKYMDKFFGEDADRYRRKHLLGALSFIPYGAIVDEFQHEVYAHPEYTPAERNALYLSLEKKYRPYLDFAGIPYLENGSRWQFQMHIYETPFYYIDYCLAQTVALNFLFASQKDYSGTLARYLAFVRAGGTRPFGALVEGAGLPSPFAEGGLRSIGKNAIELADALRGEKG